MPRLASWSAQLSKTVVTFQPTFSSSSKSPKDGSPAPTIARSGSPAEQHRAKAVVGPELVQGGGGGEELEVAGGDERRRRLATHERLVTRGRVAEADDLDPRDRPLQSPAGEGGVDVGGQVGPGRGAGDQEQQRETQQARQVLHP
jgi:hypothetical protein